MGRKVIRSNVFVIQNAQEGIYEATEDPNIMKVNIRQVEYWFHNQELLECVKEVTLDTSMSIWKKGFIVPGNILTAYQLEPIREDDPEYGLLWDEHGDLVKTNRGYPIYNFWYYNSNSKYCPDGEIPGQDSLEELINDNVNTQ